MSWRISIGQASCRACQLDVSKDSEGHDRRGTGCGQSQGIHEDTNAIKKSAASFPLRIIHIIGVGDLFSIDEFDALPGCRAAKNRPAEESEFFACGPVQT